jgi:hypothetical protein
MWITSIMSLASELFVQVSVYTNEVVNFVYWNLIWRKP